MNDHAADQLRKALTTIASLWAAMYPTGPRTPRVGTIGRTQTNPMPIPAPVMPNTAGDTVDVATVLAQWALVIADDKDLHPTVRCKRPVWFGRLEPLPAGHYGPERLTKRLVCGCNIAPRSTNLDHRLPATDTVAVARFIHTHADHLAGIDEAVDEITTAARVVARIAEPPGALEFVGRCEICDGDLRSRGGRALCRDCGNVVDAEATREQVLEKALDKIMPAYEIVTLAPRMWDDLRITNVHITRWVKRGDLISAGQVTCSDGKMRPGYRVRDVEKLAMRHATSRRSA